MYLQAERDQIAHFEGQFAQIKDVMGAESVSEIIDKFTSQAACPTLLTHPQGIALPVPRAERTSEWGH